MLAAAPQGLLTSILRVKASAALRDIMPQRRMIALLRKQRAARELTRLRARVIITYEYRQCHYDCRYDMPSRWWPGSGHFHEKSAISRACGAISFFGLHAMVYYADLLSMRAHFTFQRKITATYGVCSRPAAATRRPKLRQPASFAAKERALK